MTDNRPELGIKDGWVFASRGVNRKLLGSREIVVTSVYPTKLEASVRDLRTGFGWRMRLLSLANPNAWEHVCNAWETSL